MSTQLPDVNFHLAVYQAAGQRVTGLPADTWVSVERFTDEHAGRARYHDLHQPALALDLGIALLRAAPSPPGEAVHGRTVLIANAEVARLYQSGVQLATGEQEQAFAEAVMAARAKLEEEFRARLAPPPRAKSTPRLTAALAGALAALVAVLLFGQVAASMRSGSLSDSINRTFGASR
ncbi:hypothetical protein NK718_13200 [Alsobacter sp. SYSU M60028]|uniref:Uncharacterized protein n=1 Tax=Alsobacter ponti TaxID=2962936 RepID=A0ABT1LED3_9HYPH|nr:hypothetical protein [Alsobacter ponti]MCP8939476.1 hypothetical protein [Alsobacter ponti]